MEKRIFIGADHAGFEYKERMKKYLTSKKIGFNDMGPYSYEKNDDYPEYALKVAELVVKNPGARGILICGTGAGMTIAANKVKGVRAVDAYDSYSAKMSREHNDSNVLSLGARNLSFDKLKKIVTVWLKTPFSNEERHKRRIKRIVVFEQKNISD